MIYSKYPRPVVEDIARLRRKIAESGLPAKLVDKNLIIASWNIRAFGDVYPHWVDNSDSPKRNYRAMASIAEIVRNIDVIAIQEVRRDLSGLFLLLDWLGPDWGYVISDITVGDEGNTERLAYVYDRRRVSPTGLAGEIVLPPSPQGDPAVQFARTPYLVGFRAGNEYFTLLTAHIKYGDNPDQRVDEIRQLAQYTATEIRDRASITASGDTNLIVLGDFNIDQREDNPLFQAFISTGLTVPPQLLNLRTAYGTVPKYYDQIAWFMTDMTLNALNAGVIDFTGAIQPDITLRALSYRVSDHFPIWVELGTDHSAAQMAPALGVDPAMPDPLSVVS